MQHAVVARLFRRALADPSAIRHSLSCVEWDISGSCQAPVTREFFARPSVPPTDLVRWRPVRYNAAGTEWRAPTKRAQKRRITVDGKGKVPLTVILHAKCRKCEDCLRKRAAHWRLRAISETSLSSRTWFGTLTLRPEEQHRMLSLARVIERQRGATDFDTLPASEQFALVVKRCGIEITKYLKRVREASGARFRYLLVAERHATGLPHFHMLLHEWGSPVREAVLSRQWQMGFSKWRLAPPDNPRAVVYLCKYLSKSAEARVRASARYGQGPRPMGIADADGGQRDTSAPSTRSDWEKFVNEVKEWFDGSHDASRVSPGESRLSTDAHRSEAGAVRPGE